MKQAQWIVIGVAVTLFGVLSLLPKHVVENDAIAVNEGVTTTEDSNHAAEVSSELKLAINIAKREFNAASEELKPALLDSLIVKFILANRYDSAAKYAANFAQTSNAIDWQVRAGELYYEAFTFALSETKAAEMAARAQEFLSPIVKENPERYDLRVKLGSTYITSGAPMQGVMMIRKVLEDDPKNIFALMQLGILSMRSGQYDKAINRFNSVLDIKEEVEALYYLGIAHVSLDHHQEAEDALNRAKALATDPAMLQTINQYLKDLSEHKHE